MWCISAHEYVVGETKIRCSFKALVSQVSRRNMLLNAAVNSLDDMVSPCCTPPLMLMLLLSLCM